MRIDGIDYKTPEERFFPPQPWEEVWPEDEDEDEDWDPTDEDDELDPDLDPADEDGEEEP